jgi:hypothetical protein
MMCVNETFPPRVRFKWFVITVRLSIINFAGIARTLVAVGTESDASIEATTRPATPRSGSKVAAPGVFKTGAGLTGACAGVGVETCGVAATGAAGATGAAATGAGTETTGATGAAATGAGAETLCAALGTGGVPPFGAGLACAVFAEVVATGADVAAPGE